MPPRKAIAASILTLIAFVLTWRALFPPPTLREELESIDNLALDSRRSAWGFNFEPAVVPLDGILNTSYPHEAISSLVMPDLMTPAQAALDGGLTSGTWVAGVTINGESRAYPNTLLIGHECINDVLGGEPIAVTYQGISDGLMVLSRRTNNRVLEFGNTGLVYHSSLLLYDRQSDPHDRSLWSQVERRAITGPAAGQNLQMIDVDRVSLVEWIAEHSETTIASHNTAYFADYVNDRMATYYKVRPLVFPPSEKREAARIAPSKAGIVLVCAGDRERAYLLRDIKREGGIVDRLGDAVIELKLTEPPLERRARHAAFALLILSHSPTGWNTLQFNPSYPYTSLRRMRLTIAHAAGSDRSIPIARAFMLWHVWESIYPDGDYYRSKYADEFEAENKMEDEENES